MLKPSRCEHNNIVGYCLDCARAERDAARAELAQRNAETWKGHLTIEEGERLRADAERLADLLRDLISRAEELVKACEAQRKLDVGYKGMGLNIVQETAWRNTPSTWKTLRQRFEAGRAALAAHKEGK